MQKCFPNKYTISCLAETTKVIHISFLVGESNLAVRCIPWLLMRVNWTLVSVAAANRPCHNLPEENKVRNKREGKQLGNLKYEHCQWTYLHSDPQNTPLQEQTLKEIY